LEALDQGSEPAETLLSITKLTKAFPGTLALSDVDFELKRGEIHALLGQNGAGKSTLIKILAGVYGATSGEIRCGNRLVHPITDKLPINFIHQDLGLVDAMSVAENVAIGAGYSRRAGLISWRDTRRAAERALAIMHSNIDPETDAGLLSAAEKSIVAIARALATRCDILVLDEPTASLPEDDVGRLFAALDRLRAAGLGIIYVSHRLDEVFRISDRVTILRDGHKITTEAVGALTPDLMVSMIVGRELSKSSITDLSNAGNPLLRVEGLRSGNAGPVSFQAHPGEALALVGLRGAGNDTIARAVFGDTPIDAGTITLSGAPLRPRDPDDAISAKVGFISSKRGEESMAAALSVRENLFINPTLTGTGPLGWLGPAAERKKAAAVTARYSIRPPDPERVIATLSGGNQQKVIVARWLEGEVELLILEEPTTGVDVGSKAEIYSLMQRSLTRGMAVLLVSSDFEEVAKVCHRALVFNRGRVVAEIDRANLSVSTLTSMAGGGDASTENDLETAE
jgi:ribose transport system ATP-binding protein